MRLNGRYEPYKSI